MDAVDPGILILIFVVSCAYYHPREYQKKYLLQHQIWLIQFQEARYHALQYNTTAIAQLIANQAALHAHLEC
jgi:hypothetical protein